MMSSAMAAAMKGVARAAMDVLAQMRSLEQENEAERRRQRAAKEAWELQLVERSVECLRELPGCQCRCEEACEAALAQLEEEGMEEVSNAEVQETLPPRVAP